MSLVTVTSPLHAIGPHVWWDEGRLCARTSRFWQGATLGAWRKEVVVDPGTRTVAIHTRTFWLAKGTVEVPFDAISHVAYRHGGFATAWIGGLRGSSLQGTATDGVESYSVALALHDRDEIHLFSFMGDDSHQTGVAGVLLGDSIVDVRGDQQERSLRYVDALLELTGKGLSSRSRPNRYRAHEPPPDRGDPFRKGPPSGGGGPIDLG